MFIMDVPSIPAQEPPVMVADATAAQGGSAPQQVDRVIGVCHLSDGSTSDGALEPPMEIRDYFRKAEQYKIIGSAAINILQMPAHGTLDGPVDGAFAYIPEKGYLGNDRATLLVEVGGKKVRMEYFFRVMQHVPDQEGVDAYADYCPNKVRVWKISSTTDTNGNTILAAVDYQSLAANADGASAANAGSTTTLDAAAINAALGSSTWSSPTVSTPSVTVTFADLPGGVNTMGSGLAK